MLIQFEVLHYISKFQLCHLHIENHSKITALLYFSKLPCDYNDHQFQRFDKRILTCGRWTGHRLKHHHLTNDKYIEQFCHLKDKDIVKKSTLVKTIEEASYLSVKYNKLPFKDNENDLYEVKESQTFIKNDSYVPLFNQVLDLEAIELYKMSEIITNFNGILLIIILIK